MDQQPLDPNNPTQPTNPVPPTEPSAPAASIWGNQPDLSAYSQVPVEPMVPTAPIVAPSMPVPEPVISEPVTEAVPTFVPPASQAPAPAIPPPTQDISSVPAWATTSESATPPLSTMNNLASVTAPPESMPTDLSHLMGNSTPVAEAVSAQPETIVPPTIPETNQVVTGGSKGFPKVILIIFGLILLLIVGGASAYFILGIGNSFNLPISLPAQQQPLTNPPTQIVPSVAPLESGTGSATLSNPSGATSSEIPTPTKVATNSAQPGSAIELLRSRVSPTPVQ